MHSKVRLAKNVVMGIVLSGVGLAAACSSDTKRAALLAAPCSLNSDCNSPLVCAFQRCHNACTETRDCPTGERCVASDRPFHVCQLPSEKPCVKNADCPTGQVCGVDAQCRDQCTTSRDCLPGQVCVSATCAETTELTNGRLPSINVDASTGGTPCSYNSECPSPMLCRAGTCAYDCLADRDCAQGSRCIGNLCTRVTGDAGSIPDGAKTCFYNSDCTPGICRSGVCMVECRTNVDCDAGMACVSGACKSLVPPDAPAGYGTTCNIPSDCTSPLICGAAGQCVYQCNSSIDCSTGLCCVNHECTTGAACGTADGGPTPPATDAAPGAPCVSNANCDDGLYCNGQERCYAGRCAPALDTPCDSHSACIKDTCTEATKTCTSTVLAPQDYDKDGHLDFACGGDDCNDADSTIYTGAPELCDGKDNNCNGIIDDYSRVPHGTLLGGTVLNQGYCAGCGYTMHSATGATLGSGLVMFYGSAQYNGTGALHAQYFDSTGASAAGLVKLFDVGAPGSDTLGVLDAAGEQATAAVVYWRTNSYQTTTIAVVNSTLSTVSQAVLNPMGTAAGNADVVWTGSQYFVGFTNSTNVASVALVDTSANIVGGIQQVVTPGTSISTSPIRVAASGSTLGVAYIDPTANHPALNVLTSAGAPQVGPIVLTNTATSTPTFWGLAAAPGGYVLAYKDNVLGDVLTYVKSDGTVGKTVKLPTQGATQGSGFTDGAGAAFALRYVDGTHSVYAPGALDRVEEELAIAPPSPNSGDWSTLSGYGTRLVAFHYTLNEYRAYAIGVGCPP